MFAYVSLGMSLILGACGNKKEPRPEETAPASQSEERVVPKEEPKPVEKKTSANALNAFNGESNAGKRHTVFAVKADEEGCKDVANLFRAAAKSESIYAASSAEIIAKQGGTPTAASVEPEV